MSYLLEKHQGFRSRFETTWAPAFLAAADTEAGAPAAAANDVAQRVRALLRLFQSEIVPGMTRINAT